MRQAEVWHFIEEYIDLLTYKIIDNAITYQMINIDSTYMVRRWSEALNALNGALNKKIQDLLKKCINYNDIQIASFLKEYHFGIFVVPSEVCALSFGSGVEQSPHYLGGVAISLLVQTCATIQEASKNCSLNSNSENITLTWW